MTKKQDVSENFSQMLVSILVHDLRQPFSTLITATDIITHSEHALSEKELHAILKRVRHTASKSIELLDGLVSWMKSHSEGYTYKTQPLLLRDLIQEANDFYLSDQLDKAIEISNAIPRHQLVNTNKEMLQFINRNILSNATKYSPRGGIINIASSIEDNWITVAFTDEGIGIPEEQIKNLFNIHDTEKIDNHPLKGAGIALSICQDMIHKMNGKIWVESSHGHGATFFYSLPFLV